MVKNNVELLAPVGSYESLMAAIKAGADSVYFGVEQLNMRAKSADNFTIKDLKKIVKICKKNNLNSYLTLNTVLYDHDIPLMKKICDAAKETVVSAVIASDMAALVYANSVGLSANCSTQLNISNIEAVRFYSRFSDIIVLARELTLKQITDICNEIKKEKIKGPNGELVKIEIFIHGAMCVAISGKCYMSLATFNSSANRGACLQNCRRSYRVIDDETGDELVLDNKYVMSPKDICTISFIDKLVSSGASVFKIEGRGRGPEYVYAVTKAYKESIDSYFDGTYTKAKIKKWTTELESVYNRGLWHGGYYLGKKLGEWSGVYGSRASKEKKLIGVVKNYFRKPQVAEFFLNAGSLEKGDDLMIIGPTTGVVETKALSIFLDEKEVRVAAKGTNATIPVPSRVRPRDKLYVIKDRI